MALILILYGSCCFVVVVVQPINIDLTIQFQILKKLQNFGHCPKRGIRIHPKFCHVTRIVVYFLFNQSDKMNSFFQNISAASCKVLFQVSIKEEFWKADEIILVIFPPASSKLVTSVEFSAKNDLIWSMVPSSISWYEASSCGRVKWMWDLFDSASKYSVSFQS